MSPRVERPLPPYLQITTHFRELIQSGQMRDGERLPTARQIVEQWGVAHATGAKVIATLRSEGLVKTLPGAGGTVVSVREVARSPRDRFNSSRRHGRIYPPGQYARIIAAELVTAPDEIADALGVAPVARVIRRHRITFQDDGLPVSASTSWFDGALAEAAPALLLAERIQQGTPGYIEQKTGRRGGGGRDQFTAGLASAETAAELGIAEGDPVLIGRNWYLDTDGAVLEFGQSIARAEQWQTYEYDAQ